MGKKYPCQSNYFHIFKIHFYHWTKLWWEVTSKCPWLSARVICRALFCRGLKRSKVISIKFLCKTIKYLLSDSCKVKLWKRGLGLFCLFQFMVSGDKFFLREKLTISSINLHLSSLRKLPSPLCTSHSGSFFQIPALNWQFVHWSHLSCIPSIPLSISPVLLHLPHNALSHFSLYFFFVSIHWLYTFSFNRGAFLALVCHGPFAHPNISSQPRQYHLLYCVVLSGEGSISPNFS